MSAHDVEPDDIAVAEEQADDETAGSPASTVYTLVMFGVFLAVGGYCIFHFVLN